MIPTLPKTYAGIGSRQTPEHVLKVIYDTAILLAKDGYTCNTGAALGADQEFAKGTIAGNGTVDLMLPWPSYEKEWVAMLSNLPTGNVLVHPITSLHTAAFESVKQFHPNPAALKQSVTKLHARNYMIIENTHFVVCWTPGGELKGGTAQGIRIAESLGIYVYNLGDPTVLAAFEDKLEQRKEELL